MKMVIDESKRHTEGKGTKKSKSTTYWHTMAQLED